MIRLATLLTLFASHLGATPPTTLVRPVSEDYHGTTVVDPYRWLEEGETDKVRYWVDKQHRYRKDLLSECKAVTTIEKTLISQFQGSDWQRLYEIGEGQYLLIDKISTDLQPIFYLWADGEDPVTLINPNEWPKGDAVVDWDISPDGRYLNYSRTHCGDETPVVYFIDLLTRETLPDQLKGKQQRSVEWHPEEPRVFYAAFDDSQENDWEMIGHGGVYSHTIGEESKLLFSKPDGEAWYYFCWIEEEELYLGRHMFGQPTEIYLLPLDDLEAEPELIQSEEDWKHFVRHSWCGDEHYVIHDYNENLREVCRIVGKEKIEPVIAASDLLYCDLKGIGGRLYLEGRRDGYSVIEVYSEAGERLRELPLPGLGSAFVHGEWEDETCYVMFESLTQSPTTYLYNFGKNSLRKLGGEECPFTNPQEYETRLALVPSTGGVLVPMLVGCRRDLPLDGENPALITAYGGFGVEIWPSYNTYQSLFMATGGVFAQPQIRGGGERGYAWHFDGWREKKQNVFDDFINCTSWLHEKGYASPETTACRGGSNGGLLIGAMVTQAPFLYKAAICGVPLLDMLRFHHFRIGRTWVDEYGCADREEDFPHIYAYSPYHNIKEQCDYPAVYVASGGHDGRVDPLHARKMVARLQAENVGDNPIVLDENPLAGHGYAPGWQGYCADYSRILGWVVHHLDLDDEFLARFSDDGSRDLPWSIERRLHRLDRFLDRFQNTGELKEESDRQWRHKRMMKLREQQLSKRGENLWL